MAADWAPAAQTMMWMILVNLLILATVSEETNIQEYCLEESFDARCDPSQVLRIQSAQYGRMKLGRCVEEDTGSVGCSRDILNYMSNLCSAHIQCHIPMVGSLQQQWNPCKRGQASYLEVDYICLPVISSNGPQCQVHGSSGIGTISPGYLANIVSQDSQCGNQERPWVIEVPPTKKIQLSLEYFGSYEEDSPTVRSAPQCKLYAMVNENEASHEFEVCDHEAPQNQVYTSTGSMVEVYLLPPNKLNGQHFLIKFEVVGCDEPDYPDNMWIRYDQDHVTVGCYTSEASWRLECHNNTWRGEVGNCTISTTVRAVVRSTEPVKTVVEVAPFPVLSDPVIIVITVSVTVVLSIILLIIGFVRGKWHIHSPMAEEVPLQYDTMRRRMLYPDGRPLFGNQANQLQMGSDGDDSTFSRALPPVPQLSQNGGQGNIVIPITNSLGRGKNMSPPQPFHQGYNTLGLNT